MLHPCSSCCAGGSGAPRSAAAQNCTFAHARERQPRTARSRGAREPNAHERAPVHTKPSRPAPAWLPPAALACGPTRCASVTRGASHGLTSIPFRALPAAHHAPVLRRLRRLLFPARLLFVRGAGERLRLRRVLPALPVLHGIRRREPRGWGRRRRRAPCRAAARSRRKPPPPGTRRRLACPSGPALCFSFTRRFRDCVRNRDSAGAAARSYTLRCAGRSARPRARRRCWTAART